jgi:hypothetical protein
VPRSGSYGVHKSMAENIDPVTGKLILRRAVEQRSRRRSAQAAKAVAGRPPKYTKTQIIEALKKSGGFKSRACRMLGCKYTTLNRYLERYPSLQTALNEIDEQYKDMAEFSLLKQVKKENTQATLFYLSRKGKDRGYADPKDQAAQNQFNQFNLGLPGGGTWLDLMEKAHTELLSKGKPTNIALAPPKEILIEAKSAEEKE